MATGPGSKKLVVITTLQADKDLAGIYRWSADYYGNKHAKTYIDFLLDEFESLGQSPLSGKLVADNNDLRYLTIRRKNARHGHIAIYRIQGQAVEIVHIFHTAQSWLERLSKKQ